MEDGKQTGVIMNSKELTRIKDMHQALSPTEYAMVFTEELRAIIELAEIGLAWRTDSSLEKWFPFTAEELKTLKLQLAGALQEIKHLHDYQFRVSCDGQRDLLCIQIDRHTVKRFQPHQVEAMAEEIVCEAVANLLRGTDAFETFKTIVHRRLKKGGG